MNVNFVMFGLYFVFYILGFHFSLNARKGIKHWFEGSESLMNDIDN
jgi:hypothetical protein